MHQDRGPNDGGLEPPGDETVHGIVALSHHEDDFVRAIGYGEVSPRRFYRQRDPKPSAYEIRPDPER